MIDGISIETEILNFDMWRLKMPFEISTPINTDTGAIISSKKYDNSINGKFVQNEYETITLTAEFETYKIVIRQVVKLNSETKYYLKLNGSLHKNKFGGANYERFYFYDIVNEIDKICKTLLIDSKRTKIVNIEFGVNIEVDFEPHKFLNEYLISYKNEQFNQYAPDKKGRRIGYECILSQYTVKCYDKGLQFSLPYNLMRFELKYKKMQKLNKIGIYNLHDLTNLIIYPKLKQLLLQSWNSILLYEPIPTENTILTDLQLELIKVGNSFKYWNTLYLTDKRKLFYRKNVFINTMNEFGKGYFKDIELKINNEWNLLFEPKLSEITINIKGKLLQSSNLEQKRFCKSCNSDISHQKNDSSFCSAKYVGYENAHRCRNTKNNFKYKIEKIQSKGILFDIEPFFCKKVRNYF